MRPRAPTGLRCAYCHDEAHDARPCAACATRLHADCWALAATCPTLGCALAARPRLVVLRAAAAAIGADPFHLATWLLVLAGWWLVLWTVVDAFRQMFREVGVSLPWATARLIDLASTFQSPTGHVACVCLAAGSVLAYRRWRARPGLRVALVTGTWLGVLAVPASVYALFCPLIEICQKL